MIPFKSKTDLVNKNRSLIRVSTAGSVDDGKSTLIGRLLHDSKSLFEDILENIIKVSSQVSDDQRIDFSLFTDGLKSEREQKITIDVAYIYFSTPNRNFILADTPGHEQYTRNMATGASTSHAAIILVDATKGVVTQTKRHSFILSLLGVKHIILAVNKMDLVNYNQEVFLNISNQYKNFASRLDISDISIIPVCAIGGDNVVNKSENMPWYQGESLLSVLDNLYIDGDRNLIDLRIPIQGVVRPDQNFRGFMGQLASGVLRKGDEVLVLPSLEKAKIKDIISYEGSLNLAFSPMSVTFTLDREIDIGRGDMICSINNIPNQSSEIEAMIVWMNSNPLDLTKTYIIKKISTQTKCQFVKLQYKVDINSLSRTHTDDLVLNEIGRVTLRSHKTLFFDNYYKNKQTGSFIIIDQDSNQTVAAGIIIDRNPEKLNYNNSEEIQKIRNLTKEASLISLDERSRAFGNQAKTFWITGLSGAGKSSIAKLLERKLFDRKHMVLNLDGDNMRMGLCCDLTFSRIDRKENVRRVAEVAKLLNQAGVNVLVSLISPFQEDREKAKQIIGNNFYKEIYVDAPLSVCKSRDPKGLYQKVYKGEIDEFTGVSSLYEVPKNYDLHIRTDQCTIEEAVDQILKQFF